MNAVEKIVEPAGPKTLMQAHRELVRIRPGRDASSVAWLAYYQRSASVYEQIAKLDPDHEGEAQYWAQRERTRAQNISTQIRAQTPNQ